MGRRKPYWRQVRQQDNFNRRLPAGAFRIDLARVCGREKKAQMEPRKEASQRDDVEVAAAQDGGIEDSHNADTDRVAALSEQERDFRLQLKYCEGRADTWQAKYEEAYDKLQRSDAAHRKLQGSLTERLRKAWTTHWRWEDAEGTHCTFNMKANCELEEAFQQWQAFGANSTHSTKRVTSGAFVYEVDFTSMSQENVQTHTKRKVSRVALGLPSHDGIVDRIDQVLELRAQEVEAANAERDNKARELTAKASELAALRAERGAQATREAQLKEAKAQLEKKVKELEEKVQKQEDYYLDELTTLEYEAQQRERRAKEVAEAKAEALAESRRSLEEFWRIPPAPFTVRKIDEGSLRARVGPLLKDLLIPLLPEGFEPDAELNEVVLVHGCSREASETIIKEGFDVRRAGSRGAVPMYGRGVYFAQEPCKSSQYTDESNPRHLLIARVTLGDCGYLSGSYDSTLPPERDPSDPGKGRVDAIVVNPANSRQNQAHREFVIFDGKQAYPELRITYEIT